MNYPQIMSPLSPLPLKVGGHVPPAPMGAPPMEDINFSCDKRFYSYTDEKGDYVFMNENGYYERITA